MLEAIPPEIRAAVGSEKGAEAALFALLLGEGELRGAQLAVVSDSSSRVAAWAGFQSIGGFFDHVRLEN